MSFSQTLRHCEDQPERVGTRRGQQTSSSLKGEVRPARNPWGNAGQGLLPRSRCKHQGDLARASWGTGGGRQAEEGSETWNPEGSWRLQHCCTKTSLPQVTTVTDWRPPTGCLTTHSLTPVHERKRPPSQGGNRHLQTQALSAQSPPWTPFPTWHHGRQCFLQSKGWVFPVPPWAPLQFSSFLRLPFQPGTQRISST